MHKSMPSNPSPVVLMPIAVCTVRYRLVSVCRPLGEDHGLEILALGHLRLELLDDVGQVRDVLGWRLVSVEGAGRVRPGLHLRAWSTRSWGAAGGIRSTGGV